MVGGYHSGRGPGPRPRAVENGQMSDGLTTTDVIAVIGGMAAVFGMIGILFKLGRDRENIGREMGAAKQRDEDQTERIKRLEARLDVQEGKQGDVDSRLARIEGAIDGLKETLGKSLDEVKTELRLLRGSGPGQDRGH